MIKINDKIVPITEIKDILNCVRRGGAKTIVSTNGIYDILHIGHVTYLRDASKLGDILVVGVNSDESVKKIKGDNRPIIPEEERSEVIANLETVDFVTIFNETEASYFINQVRPDIHVKGGDYRQSDIQEKELVETLGGKVWITPYYQDRSVTNLIADIVKRYSFVDINTIFPTIVKKDWGYEFWIHNEKSCYKILVLNHGWECSLHYHQLKCEVFTVLQGSMYLELGSYNEYGNYVKSEDREMMVGDSVHVHNRTVHRFRAINELCVVLETSTHHDDSDTYRLEISHKFGG